MSGELGYTPESNDLMFTDTVDGETVTQIYNLGDMAWSELSPTTCKSSS
jgi:hypothetical protein